MKVKGKTIVVTGGGNGMGRELVLNLLYRVSPGYATRFISRKMKSLLPD